MYFSLIQYIFFITKHVEIRFSCNMNFKNHLKRRKVLYCSYVVAWARTSRAMPEQYGQLTTIIKIADTTSLNQYTKPNWFLRRPENSAIHHGKSSDNSKPQKRTKRNKRQTAYGKIHGTHQDKEALGQRMQKTTEESKIRSKTKPGTHIYSIDSLVQSKHDEVRESLKLGSFKNRQRQAFETKTPPQQKQRTVEPRT